MRFDSAREIKPLLFDEWWKNTLLFYFGLVRSMDNIKVISRHSAGKGHILIEYLVEADYTTIEKRKSLLDIMVQDILKTSRFERSMLEACRPVISEL